MSSGAAGAGDEPGTSGDLDVSDTAGLGGPGADSAAVFVDSSGRRARLVRQVGMVAGLAFVAYLLAIGVSLLSGAQAPLTPWTAAGDAGKKTPDRPHGGPALKQLTGTPSESDAPLNLTAPTSPPGGGSDRRPPPRLGGSQSPRPDTTPTPQTPPSGSPSPRPTPSAPPTPRPDRPEDPGPDEPDGGPEEDGGAGDGTSSEAPERSGTGAPA